MKGIDTMNKLTNKAVLDTMITVVTNYNTQLMRDYSNEEILERLEAMKKSFSKKSSTPSKKDKERIERTDAIKSAIMEWLNAGNTGTATEILRGICDDPERKVQTITPALTKLYAEKYIDKKLGEKNTVVYYPL